MFHLDASTLQELARHPLKPSLDASAREHLVGCPDCRHSLAQFGVDQPSPVLLEKLLQAATPRSQFLGMAPELARMLDLTEPAALGVLERASAQHAIWLPLPFPGCAFRPIRSGGARVARSRRFFVRVRSGARFPNHPHSRDEELLVLQGGALDSLHREFWRGQTLHTSVGTWHSFGALGPLDCVCAVVQSSAIQRGLAESAGSDR